MQGIWQLCSFLSVASVRVLPAVSKVSMCVVYAHVVGLCVLVL